MRNINPVIYAEISVGFQRIEEVEAAVGGCGIRLVETPREALFLAGKAFLRYRRNRGAREFAAAGFLYQSPGRHFPSDPRFSPDSL